jgi:predicted RNA-binding protein associated with RNAse of E/G family
VDIHYRRLPDRLDVYRQRLVEARADVHVTFQESTPVPGPMRVGDRTVLEPGSPVVWFTFPGRWHDIGRFHDARGRFTGIYSNILTPCVMHPPDPDPARPIVWETTDLLLDVWVGTDGEPHLLDEDDFRAAAESGALTPDAEDAARREADRIFASIAAGSWPPPVVHEWTLERVRALGL